MIRDLSTEEFAAPLRRRPVHGDRPRQPLPLHRRARLRPAADGRVLADPARLLRLRGDPHRTAGARLRHARDEQQHRAVHRHDDRFGPQHDQRVRSRAAGAGRRDRRQRSLPDRDSRQRPSVLQTRLRRRPARRVRQPQGPPTRHGRRCPRRVQPHQAQRVRDRAGRVAARALPRRRARARDLEPDLRQRPLRRDPVPGHADDLRRPERSASDCCPRRSTATGSTPSREPSPMSATRPRSACPRRWRRSQTASGRARTPPTATGSTRQRSTASTSRSPNAAAAPRSISRVPRARPARASTPPRSMPRRPSAWRSSTCSIRGRRFPAGPGATSTSSSRRARWSAPCRPTAPYSSTTSRAR